MHDVWQHPKVRLWDLPPKPPAVPPGLTGQDAYRFIVAAPFEAYAARQGKQRWGDKTPHYVHHIDHLLRLWPDARFVVLVRDGRDVALSLRRMPFGPNNAWAAAQWWARGVRAGARAQREHPDAVLTVRYEALAERPEQEVPRLCGFLGLGYDADMLALDDVDPALIVPDQAAWFPTLFDGINTSAVGRWKREMSRRDRRVFAALAGAELEQLDYDVGRGTMRRLAAPGTLVPLPQRADAQRQLPSPPARAGARARAALRARAAAARPGPARRVGQPRARPAQYGSR